MGKIVTFTKPLDERDDRLAEIGKLSRQLGDDGAYMLVGMARYLLADSLLRATGIPTNTSNPLEIARFLDARALLDLIEQAQRIVQERNRGVKRAKVFSITPDKRAGKLLQQQTDHDQSSL